MAEGGSCSSDNSDNDSRERFQANAVKFKYLIDEQMTRQLQEREIDQYYDWNRFKNGVIRQDVPLAKRLQTDVEIAAEQERMRQETQAATDRAEAERLKKLEEEESKRLLEAAKADGFQVQVSDREMEEIRSRLEVMMFTKMTEEAKAGDAASGEAATNGLVAGVVAGAEARASSPQSSSLSSDSDAELARRLQEEFLSEEQKAMWREAEDMKLAKRLQEEEERRLAAEAAKGPDRTVTPSQRPDGGKPDVNGCFVAFPAVVLPPEAVNPPDRKVVFHVKAKFFNPLCCPYGPNYCRKYDRHHYHRWY